MDEEGYVGKIRVVICVLYEVLDCRRSTGLKSGVEDGWRGVFLVFSKTD